MVSSAGAAVSGVIAQPVTLIYLFVALNLAAAGVALLGAREARAA